LTQQAEADWDALRTTVRRVIEEGRLGTPAVVRCLLRPGTGSEEISAGTAKLTALAADWFGCEPSASYSVGSADAGHTITSLRFPGGRLALIGVGTGPAGDEGGGDLMVLGSRGTLYFDIPRSMGGGA